MRLNWRWLKRTRPASEIVAHIAAGQWHAQPVLEAYIARAAQVHAATNALTEIMFEAARERALLLDEEFERTGKLVGALHGVPMTLKDKCVCPNISCAYCDYLPCLQLK